MGVPTPAADEHWQIVKALECRDVAEGSLLKRHIKKTGGGCPARPHEEAGACKRGTSR